MDLLRFLSSTQLTNQFLARVAYFVASQAHVLIRDSSHVLARDEVKRTPAWEATHFGVRYNLWVMGAILIGTIIRNFQLINCRVSVSTRQTLLPVSCRSHVGRVLLEYPRCRLTLSIGYLISDPNSPQPPMFQCHTQGQ